MDILILGGTGAMGVPLVELLSCNKENHLYVTSRNKIQSYNNVTYLLGNAKSLSFITDVLSRSYDVIIDFMIYNTEELKSRIDMFLNCTSQYFFFSSSRCYADSPVPLKENSSRLVDCCRDEEYLKTDEYGLSKGREEDLFFRDKRNNWTIIRPYITYNSFRLQLGVFEKENWLWRAINGRSIVFPKDIASKTTCLTYAPDVAGAIQKLIGNEQAYGEAFHITTDESYTWGQILDYYCIILEELLGFKPNVMYLEDSVGLQKIWNPWQIKYDRLYNRTFDNSKIESVRGEFHYTKTFDGLRKCLTSFVNKPQFGYVDGKFEGWCDHITKESTSLKCFQGKKNKINYIRYKIFG